MNFLSFAPKNSSLKRWVCFLLPAILLVGCEKDEIKVYNAPKDEPPHQQVAEDNSADNPHGTENRPRHQLSWKLPAGWKETGADGINQATFQVPGSGGKTAEVGIAQLSDLSGKDAILVNLWREEAGLADLKDEEAIKELHPVEVGGEKGSLFEVSGTSKNGPMEMVTAMVHHPDGSWFYKLAGEPSVVEGQKTAFIAFLKSIQIKEALPMTAEQPAAAASEEPAGKFNWSVPAGWKTVAPNQMQVARFSMPGKNQEKAEVFVSVFPSDTGGRLANVNRWRRQIHLPEVNETDLASLVSPLDPANSEAMLVDMTNNNQRLIGAIVPREGQYWFYKLLGDAGAVAPEKESFVAFAKSKP